MGESAREGESKLKSESEEKKKKRKLEGEGEQACNVQKSVNRGSPSSATKLNETKLTGAVLRVLLN